MKDKSKETVKVIMDFSAQRIIDMFIGACEGGSNYWCKSVTPIEYPHKVDKVGSYGAMLQGFDLVDAETGKLHHVTALSVRNAPGILALKYPRAFADILDESDDSCTADMFLQCCVFGDVLYG